MLKVFTEDAFCQAARKCSSLSNTLEHAIAVLYSI